MRYENKMDRINLLGNSSPTGFHFKRMAWFATGIALGSVVGYFFDPIRGNRRRIQLKEQIQSTGKQTFTHGKNFAQNLKNRSRGLIARWSRFNQDEEIDNETLYNRVRSSFGHKVSHAKAIEVSVNNGEVILSGPILSKEVSGLLKAAKRVRGVKKVTNQLTVHDNKAGISSLQGEGKEYFQ